MKAWLIVVLLAGAPLFGQYGRHHDALFDRVQEDLSRAQTDAYPTHEVRNRFEHARHEVGEVMAQWRAGRLDRGRLDGAIASVQHAADSRGLQSRDRDLLLRDVSRMRDFRATGEYRGDRPR